MDSDIVAADNSYHVAHTAIASFHIVSVEQLVIPMVAGEVLVYDRWKWFCNIGFNVYIEWWIEPYYVTLRCLFSLLCGSLYVTSLWWPLFCKASL